MTAAAERWISVIPGLAEHKLRVHYARGELLRHDDEALCHALNTTCQRAEGSGHGARDVLAAFLPLMVDLEHLALMERLRDRAVLAPTRLSGVDWQLCIGTASSDGLTAQQPHAILQLELNTPTPQDAEGEKQSLQMQVDRPKMQELLGTLDAIQASLDGLS